MPKRKPGGNPGIYDEVIAEEICTRISLGETMTAICSSEHMPTTRTIATWRKLHPDFDIAFMKAREDQMHAWADQIVGMMDQAIPDRFEFEKGDPLVKKYESGGRVVIEIDGKHLSHIKEAIKVRQWVMAKIAPHHYGDKQMIHNTYGIEQKDDDELISDLREALNKSGMSVQDLADLLSPDHAAKEK